MEEILSYYRDCFLEDNIRKAYDHLFRSAFEFRHFFEGREYLINAAVSRLPLEASYAAELAKSAHVYRKEKELLYFSFLLTGSRDNSHFCAPLLAYPAAVTEENGIFYLEIRQESPSVNSYFLKSLAGDGFDESAFSEELLSLFAVPSGLFPAPAEITIHLKRYLPDLNCLALSRFPELTGEREVRSAMRQEGGLTIHPASVLALCRRMQLERGIPDELDQIIRQKAYSAPLRALFAQGSTEPPARTAQGGYAPGILSHAQERIVSAASRFPCSLVIGPPGTGKTYTIASLALEHISRGQSVLITSRMDHAVDVIADKVETLFGVRNCVVRAGKSDYLRDLKQYLQDILHGLYSTDAAGRRSVQRLAAELDAMERQLRKQENRLQLCSRDLIRGGAHLASEEPGFVSGLRRWMITQRCRQQTPLWEEYGRFDRLLERKVKTTRQFLEQHYNWKLNCALGRHRTTLNTFLKALRSRTGGRQQELFGKIDLEVLLDLFPVWMVSLHDISRVLPLRREMFDLAIIDEATQCDVASCLPVFQRAKRVVIAGDPRQLRHLSFLSVKRQGELLSAHGLADADRFDYRNKSVLDTVSETLGEQEAINFLDEHYRSLPPIISFSNRRFYQDRLRVMTEKPGAGADSSIHICFCGGRRNEEGINHDEASRLLRDVEMLIGGLSDLPPVSIGILSPFRSQADYLCKELSARCSLETLEKHRIAIGTAYTFQGEERDVMFLSLGIDAGSHPSALRFLEKEDVFNVSITRARIRQHLYASVRPEQMPAGSLLRQYLEHLAVHAQPAAPVRPGEVHDAFVADVAGALRERGIEAYPACPIAGMTLDLAATCGGRCLGIDCIGYPGDFADIYSIERYRMFKRAGLPIFPLPYVNWLVDRETCLRQIAEQFQRANV